MLANNSFPYCLALEAIGDNQRDMRPCGLGKARAWCAEIRLVDGGRLVRDFLRPKVDYSQANSIGSRGVWRYYYLYPRHVYDVSEPQSWSTTERYFCRIERGHVVKIGREEAVRWLRDLSALAS